MKNSYYTWFRKILPSEHTFLVATQLSKVFRFTGLAAFTKIELRIEFTKDFTKIITTISQQFTQKTSQQFSHFHQKWHKNVPLIFHIIYRKQLLNFVFHKSKVKKNTNNRIVGKILQKFLNILFQVISSSFFPHYTCPGDQNYLLEKERTQPHYGVSIALFSLFRFISRVNILAISAKYPNSQIFKLFVN